MWLYGTGRGLLAILYRTLYRVRAEGLENIPPTGGVILCGNHFTAHDPIMVGVCANRPVQFMAKEELFRNRFLGFIMRGVGAFPVKRGQPDRAALKRSIDVLQSGGCFGIFPEGTRNRSGKLAKPEPGTAYLALKSGAPVVPVGITSTYKLFSPVIVKFGKPMSMERYAGAKLTSELLDEVGHTIMAGIGAELVPPVHLDVAAGKE
ncbi:MAG: lysophospholipid acyltransferase family protein [Mycobacterium leprae]